MVMFQISPTQLIKARALLWDCSLTLAQRRFRAVCHFRTSEGSGFVGWATTWRPCALSFLLHQV